MNRYEEKQEARRMRYLERAENASSESHRLYNRARDMASVIPFGQPILVGHHSERGDRAYRGRIHDTYGKAFAAQDKAAHYEQKAASVGSAGISSDDPDAVAKLKEKLAGLERHQDLMKKANVLVRKQDTAGLVALGYTEAQAAELLQPDFAGRVGFPSYALQNNNANIKRVKERIAQLEATTGRQDVEVAGNGYTYREDTEENRVQFLFAGKPDPATRELLKSRGFRWAPSLGAWQRQLNAAGLYAAKMVRQTLDQQ